MRIVASPGLLRSGLRALLERARELLVVGEAANGESLERGDGDEPDVALIVVGFQPEADLDTLRHWREQRPEARAVVVLHSLERGLVAEVLRMGARAALGVDALPSELVAAIREVETGGRYLHPGVASVLIDELDERSGPRPDAGIELLSAREREVIEHLALGHSSAATGAALGIGQHTVDKHRRNAMAKLGIESLAGLVKFALRAGLTSFER